MPVRIRAAGILAIVLALIAYAYAPLLAAGFLGEDLAVLASLDRLAWSSEPAAWFGVAGTEGRPGAALLLLVSRSAWTADGLWTGAEALVLRLENLALLFLAAWGLVGFLRRMLEPWAGPEVARAAGHAGAAFVLVHPLALSAVARLSARGDLAAIALGAWCGLLFLAGRQERRRGLVTRAWVLAVLAGLCSPLALFLPLALAAFEYHSARRLRPRPVRLRTGLTTLLVFGVAVAFEAVGRAALAPEGASAPRLARSAAPELWLERLGVMLMPGNVHGLGPGAPLVAALASLVALHPALVAARSAPRLWARVLLGWAAALAVTVAPYADVRVTLDALAGAQILLPAAVVMAVGLGTCSTALSGWRRTFVPIAVGGLFAILGRAQAVPHVQAAEQVRVLRGDLLEAARGRGWNGTLLVLDPPREVAGLDPVGEDLAAVLSPALPPRERAARVRVVALGRRALEVWSRLESFSRLREQGVSVVTAGEGGARAAVPLRSRGDEADRATWIGEIRTTAGTVFDPLLARHLRVTALPDADTGAPPIVRWSSDVPEGADAEVTGVWLTGDDGPVAVFDLERESGWLLAGRVRSLWLVGGLTSITAAVLSPAPPALEGATPHPVGDDWTFDLSAAQPAAPLAGSTQWRLGLFDAATLEYVERAPIAQARGRLRFAGVARWTAARQAAGADVFWFLDQRVDGVSVARAGARRPGLGAPADGVAPGD